MRNPFELAEMKNYLHVLAIICLSRSPRPPALVIAINARTFELKTWQQLLSNGHPRKILRNTGRGQPFSETLQEAVAT